MCGVVGIMGNQNVVQELYDGLITLQHRGQDAAGMATYDGRHIHLRKANGLVRDVFHTRHVLRLLGTMGLGHVRYPTAGCQSDEEAQPFYVNAPYGIALAHNGNLTNYESLKNEVVTENLRHLNTTSDSEVLLNVLAFELMKETHRQSKLSAARIFKAMTRLFKRVEGGYACVAMIAGHGLLAFRDPFGIRPLIIGMREEAGKKKEYMIASESVAFQTMGYKIVRDVQPGEAVFIDENHQLHTKQCVKGKLQPCIFEHVYLARPDSLIDQVSVYKTRMRLGVKLAKQIKQNPPENKNKLGIDVVIPIPDTSRHIALTLAHELKVKFREGFIKNRYIGRTFIMPDQEARKKSIRYKLNPIPLEFKNKNVLLVDDSIVRGNTSRKIIQLARDAGARKVYFASAAPPIINPDVYGIDMPTRKELVAHNRTIDQVCEAIGADKLYYQTLDDLIAAAREGNPKIKKFTASCMGGGYPAGNITEEVLKRVEEARPYHDTDDVNKTAA
ncbi:amidophosphoribosyltransferase [Candidatus Peregrinibacteria bacterium]|nr:MAG: amidophosphoribosyltransferase [Candidatus Peregrinibacteria bacterium]